MKILKAIIASVAVVCISSPAYAYEEVPVTDGGTLSGTVTLQGDVPKPKGYNLTTLPDQIYCGRISDGRGWRLLQPFNVGKNGEFRQVVVHLEDIEKGKPFGDYAPPRIEAVDCRFMPFVNVVRDLHDIVVVNMDPAFHDIQAYETSQLGPRVLFNVPLPISKRYPNEIGLSDHFHKHYEGIPMVQTVKMTKGRRIFTMQCGFHAYMESWALVVDHPYYAITDENGKFEIGDIPPGTYKVTIWHPYLHEAYEQVVTVKPKEAATAEFNVAAPTGRLYANQMVENAFVRYTITEDVQSQIVPTLEKQTY
ncbi:MAG: carboxypeptidase regulatory-like domain-containing protein [Nitrospirota bacterium]|nr:carboxypeptidase regulatory-like domain-containing protein [Nitrospirota bacterium]